MYFFKVKRAHKRAFGKIFAPAGGPHQRCCHRRVSVLLFETQRWFLSPSLRMKASQEKHISQQNDPFFTSAYLMNYAKGWRCLLAFGSSVKTSGHVCVQTPTFTKGQTVWLKQMTALKGEVISSNKGLVQWVEEEFLRHGWIWLLLALIAVSVCSGR